MLTYKNFKIGTKFRFLVPPNETNIKYDFKATVTKIRQNEYNSEEWGIEYGNATGTDGGRPAHENPDNFISNFIYVTIVDTPQENYEIKAKNGKNIKCSIQKM